MIELEALIERWPGCGSVAARDETRRRTLAARAFALLFSAAPRERSGLAGAAGFVGLARLFGPSAAAGFEWFGWRGPVIVPAVGRGGAAGFLPGVLWLVYAAYEFELWP